MRNLLGVLALGIGVGCGLVVSGCSGGSSGGGFPIIGPPDNMNVIAFSPPNNFVDIPVTAQVRVTFDEDLSFSSIDASSFVVRDAGGPIPGTSAYDNPTRTLTFTPTSNLPPATQITVALDGSVQSTSGQFLNPGGFVFTTGVPTSIDTTPPTFGGVTGLNAQSGATVLLSWGSASDDLDGAGAISFRIYRATASAGQNFAAPVGLAGPGSTTFLDRGLTPATQYYYVVRAVDTSNNEETNVVELNVITNPATSWSTDVYPLFVGAGPANCADVGCHDATNSGGVDLRTITSAYSDLTLAASSTSDGGLSPKRRVQPGDSADSFLLEKLEGPVTAGALMPLNGVPFNSTQVDIVRDWIDEGALNN